MRLLEDKVIVVTGAGRGVGRSHALLLAQLGAKLVINDLGTDVTGVGTSSTLAQSVVDEIKDAGGDAIANTEDISVWDGSARIIQSAIDHFGRLDGLVNNAGNLRRQALVDLTEQDVDALTAVHIKGSFGCTVHALKYWRDRFERGDDPKASVVNTISEALLVSLPNYVTYGAVKGAIAHLTTCGSREALAYGVRINAYGPRALTRMSGVAFAEPGALTTDRIHPKDPGNSSPLIAWLLSEQSAHVSGQVFHTVGGAIAKCAPWTAGDLVWPPEGAMRFDISQIGPALNADIFGSRFPDLVLAEPESWRNFNAE